MYATYRSNNYGTMAAMACMAAIRSVAFMGLMGNVIVMAIMASVEATVILTPLAWMRYLATIKAWPWQV